MLPLACLGGDFSFYTNLRLSVAHLMLGATPHPDAPDILMFHGHPIRRVAICGIIVCKDERDRLITYTVDDGTGVVNCQYWFPSNQVSIRSRKTQPLGALVVITGRISHYNNMRHLIVNSIIRETDPNFEVMWWLQVQDLMQDVYSIPSDIPPDFATTTANKSGNDNDDDDGDEPNPEGRIPFSELRIRVERILGDLSSTDEPSFRQFAAAAMYVISASESLPTVWYSDIRNHSALCEAARRMATASATENQGVTDASSNMKKKKTDLQVDAVFQKLFKWFRTNGFLHIVDDQSDEYALIRHDLNLGAAVLRTVADPAAAALSGTDGVTEDAIQLLVRDESRFRHVPRSAILKSIKILERDSIIYEVRPREYKAVE